MSRKKRLRIDDVLLNIKSKTVTSNINLLFRDITGNEKDPTPNDEINKLPNIGRSNVYKDNNFETAQNVAQQDIISQINELMPEKEKESGISAWARRKSRLYDNWEQARQAIMSTVIRSSYLCPEFCSVEGCKEKAIIRCDNRECVKANFLCERCDVTTHSRKSSHERKYWNGEYFLHLNSCEYVEIHDYGGITLTRKPTLLQLREKWCQCCKNKMQNKPDLSIVYIHITGGFDLYLPVFECTCGEVTKANIHDVIGSGIWPSTTNLSEGCLLFQMDVFRIFECLKKESPSLSVRAFLSTICGLSEQKVKITTTLFTDALREWQYLNYELMVIKGRTPMQCPACNEKMHACHVDGNRKLYRYGYFDQSTLVFDYYKNLFIAHDENVNGFVNQVQRQCLETANICGTSHWKAAKTFSKTMQNRDETGLCMSCCRHAILQKAVNMFQGEIFAYPLFLQRDLLRKHPTFFCQDVICKYWPWMKRVHGHDPSLTDCTNAFPFLSVMHAKAHDWKCQVQYCGKYLEGAGTTTGEELEQVNANLSRYGFTTRTMSKAGRNDAITNAAIHWNQRKVDNIGLLLSKRYVKTMKSKVEANREMADLNLSEETIEEFVNDVRGIVSGQDVTVLAPTDAAEYFALDRQFAAIPQIEEVAEDLVVDDLLTLNKRTIKDVKVKRKRYQELKLKYATDTTKALEEGKADLFKSKIRESRLKLENLRADIRQKKAAKEKATDSSKLRARCDTKIRSLTKILANEIERYNKMARITGDQVVEAGSNDAPWPWEAIDIVSLDRKRKIFEAVEKCKRIDEELAILKREMNNVVAYDMARLQALRENHLDSLVQYHGKVTFGRYFPFIEDDDDKRCLRALVGEAYAYWEAHMETCTNLFAEATGLSEMPALNVLTPELESSDDEISESESDDNEDE